MVKTPLTLAKIVNKSYMSLIHWNYISHMSAIYLAHISSIQSHLPVIWEQAGAELCQAQLQTGILLNCD